MRAFRHHPLRVLDPTSLAVLAEIDIYESLTLHRRWRTAGAMTLRVSRHAHGAGSLDLDRFIMVGNDPHKVYVIEHMETSTDVRGREGEMWDVRGGHLASFVGRRITIPVTPEVEFLWAWGRNQFGSHGDGTLVNRDSPTRVGGTIRWKAIDGGQDHALGLSVDGELFATGRNDQGQLGDGTTTDRSVWTRIGTTTWEAISAGPSHSIGIQSTGSLWVWGDNFFGQLGDGTTTNRLVPTQTAAGRTMTSVGTGVSHSLAVLRQGGLRVSGDNSAGQLGDGTTTARPEGVNILVSDLQGIAGGEAFSMMLRFDMRLLGCGSNTFGQLGDGTTVPRHVPTLIGSSTWKVVLGGRAFCLGIDSLDRLFGWGDNSRGQLGDGTTTGRLSPGQIGTCTWIAIAVGREHALGIRGDGRLLAWGNNDQGQLGLGTTTSALLPTLVGTCTWVRIASGGLHSLGIRADARLLTWGDNVQGQLGDGTTAIKVSPTLIGTSTWKVISGGERHSHGIRADDRLLGWGENTSGEVGDGTTVGRLAPVLIGTTTWKHLALGPAQHNVGIVAGDFLVVWGRNHHGQLGTGGTSDQLFPVSPSGITGITWRAVARGLAHSLAIHSDHSVRVWGANTEGQLGTGNLAEQWIVTRIDTTGGWRTVSAGDRFSSGLLVSGERYAWGLNDNGQLGDGTITNRLVPTRVDTVTWKMISAGQSHVLGIRADDRLLAWGLNGSGQLGDGTTVRRLSPSLIGTSTWRSISAGGWFSLGILGNDLLFGWGANDVGQLGVGPPLTPRLAPTEVPFGIDGSAWGRVGTGFWTSFGTRAVPEYHRITGPIETIMKGLVAANCTTPFDTRRRVTGLVVAANQSRGSSLTYQTRFRNLVWDLERLSILSHLGWRVHLDVVTQNLVFEVYEGRDRSVSQGINPPVIIAPDLDSALAMRLVRSNLTHRNVAYVGGQGEGAARHVVLVGDVEGRGRREMFVDARDLAVRDDLLVRGQTRLAELGEEVVFEGKIRPDQPYRYQTDYDVGDIVTLRNRQWGVTLNTRVLEAIEYHQREGFELDLVFGGYVPTLLDTLHHEFEQVGSEVRR